MTVITRYLLKEFARMTAACTGGFLVLFLVVDFVERADDFLKHQAGTGEVFLYYLLRIPSVFVMIAPVAVLLAVLITVSLRARANEMTAMFSGGVSLLRACAPILVGCAIVSALSLWASEILVPHANRNARGIARLRIRPDKVAAQFSLNRYWVRGDNAVLSAQVVDTAGRSLHGFQYLEFDGDFRLSRRIDARVAFPGEGGLWTLRDGRERRFGEGGDATPVAFGERAVGLPATMAAFLDGETPPDEMTYTQLAGYVEESRARGYDVRRYEVDLHAKLSHPFLNVVISLIAVPLALRSPRSGGLWRSIGLGLLVGFFCWMALSTSLSLGRKGMMPPLLAAWLPALLFASAGGALFRRTRR